MKGQGGCQDAIVDQGNRRSCTGVQESIALRFARIEVSSGVASSGRIKAAAGAGHCCRR